MIFMVLPASAIMYASGSSDGCSILLNTDCNSDSGSTGLIGSAVNDDSPPSDFLPPNVDSSSSDGSTDDGADSSATPTENNTTLPSEPPLGNNTANVQGDDLATSILAVHNQERAAVGVPPLIWSDMIAAGAQTWADNVLATGKMVHSTGTGYGENIAWRGPPGSTTMAGLQQGWVNEKNIYVPGTPPSYSNGHYTAMVDKKSSEVGCGLASGPGGPGGQMGSDVLVCRYNPPGNWNNEPPY